MPSKYDERSAFPGILRIEDPIVLAWSTADPPHLVAQGERLKEKLCGAGHCPRIAILQHRDARAMPGVAEAVLQFLGLRHQMRRIVGRPRQHDRVLDLENAGEGGALVIFAGVGAEIGFGAFADLGVGAVDARHQHGAGDVIVGLLEFLVREIGRQMERADRPADRDDRLGVAFEQVGVLVHPGDRGRNVPCAGRPGIGGREPIIHLHADHAVMRGQAHRLVFHRIGCGRGRHRWQSAGPRRRSARAAIPPSRSRWSRHRACSGRRRRISHRA